jgi:hypothetical protein
MSVDCQGDKARFIGWLCDPWSDLRRVGHLKQSAKREACEEPEHVRGLSYETKVGFAS